MAKVFVSHASEDRECAGQLHEWLAAEHHEVFLDQDLRDGIAVGEEWDERLHERLRWADAVVCVVTTASMASTWCTAEISIARSRGSRLLPVRAEPGVVHPLLKSVQYGDLTRDPTAARAALVEALRRVDAPWPDDRSPFPGLRPLDVEDHRVFFGRSGEVEQLAGLLRSPAERAERAVLLVVGPSGCGKSSLVRAGLMPVMADEPGWLTLPAILPGADPVAALARELAVAAQRLGPNWTVAQVRHRLDDTGLTELADDLLLAARARRLLLVVDQFEELLTQIPPGQRARFVTLLRPALGGRVQVVATLRPEFLDQLLADVDLALPPHLFPLRPLQREALRAVIEGPARLAGIEVDNSLVTRLVDDTDRGEALPLLAFTLAQLAEGIGRGGRLSVARYDQLGRVQGALTRQADKALADATATTGRSRKEVIAGLLRLVTIDEQGRPTRWRVNRAELPEPVVTELDAFVTRRLVTTDADNGTVVIGVAHEKFLSAWAPLADAIKANVSALRARSSIEQAATEWKDSGHSRKRLWEGGQLAVALANTGARLQARDLVTDRVDLSSTARDFLLKSIRQDRLRRGRAIAILSGLLVLALVAAVIAVGQQRNAEQQRNVAVARQGAGQAMELRATNPALAAQLGLAAYRLDSTAETRGSLLSTVANPYATRLTGHTSSVNGMVLSPNGRTLATASDDNTARLWDIRDLRQPSPLGAPIDHTGVVYSVAFSSDGRTLATGGADNTARLWDISDLRQPSRLGTLTGHTGVVYSVIFSPGGRTLATTGADETVRLWDVSDLRQPSSLGTVTTVPTSGIYSAAFSPDGRTLVTASPDDSARLWDVSDPRQPSPLGTLTGHGNTVSAVAFSADGRTLATGSVDRTARSWDISDPRQPSPLTSLIGHTNTVSAVAFGPDGRTLATASTDNTARLWELPGPIVAHHTNTVRSLAVSPVGHTLATGSFDKTVRLWDISDPRRPSPLGILIGHDSAVRSVIFSSNGRTLATASADDTARLWDVSDPRRPSPLATLTGHTGVVYSVDLSRDGRTLATGSEDRTVRLWDVSDPRRPSPLATLIGHTNEIYSVAFSPDGHTLATGGVDQTVRMWDVSDPRQSSLLGTVRGHTNEVDEIAFSSDGRTLATSSVDNTARLWGVDVDSVTTRICDITPTITKSEWEQYLSSVEYRPPCS